MRNKEAEILTQVILTIFRVNGRLLEAGDKLVNSLQLTSAKWQVIGAVALAGRPQTAPQIGAAMGITRQGVQKQLNILLAEGLLEKRQNPKHARSPLYALTKLGKRIYAAADSLQAEWATQLAEGLSANDLRLTLRTLETINKRLTASRSSKR